MQPIRFKPIEITDFIGSARLIAETLVNTIKNAEGGPIAILLTGQPGIGKSSLANWFGRQLGADPQWSTSRMSGTECNVERVAEIKRGLHLKDLFGNYRVIQIEEADAIPSVAQVAFLDLLDHLPDKVAVICTSNKSNFEDRWGGRFQVFTPVRPTDEELTALLCRWISHKPTVQQIVTFACGDIRQSLKDAQSAIDSNPKLAVA